MATVAKSDGSSVGGGIGLTEKDRLGIYEHMLLMRKVEEKGNSLYKQGKIPGSFYDGRGQEAISVGATWALDGADVVCSPLIRDLGAHLVRGTDLASLFAHYMGRQNEISNGREGNVHLGDRRLGVVGMVSMLPDMMVVACGCALTFRLRSEARCALSFFGDGATSRGDWHEAMNWAAVDQLPVIFLMENNHFAYSTPTAKQFAVNPIERGSGYGVASESVDGNDPDAVFAAVARARSRALAGDGPTLIEAITMRMHGHGAHDDAKYAKGLVAEWAERDPIARYRRLLEEAEIEVGGVDDALDLAIATAVEKALATPMPDAVQALEGVFAQGEPEPLGVGQAPWSGFRGG
jgi:TPP-dependent pyruvate/acetoin dehydrogenase alpha subunit